MLKCVSDLIPVFALINTCQYKTCRKLTTNVNIFFDLMFEMISTDAVIAWSSFENTVGPLTSFSEHV
jgi:hypothetical protein